MVHVKFKVCFFTCYCQIEGFYKHVFIRGIELYFIMYLCVHLWLVGEFVLCRILVCHLRFVCKAVCTLCQEAVLCE